MLDSVLIVNEIVDEAKRKKKPTIIFKVDYEKAYDSVRWDFLWYMLQRMNFCDKWIKWIKGCLESNSVSVLINGSPGPEFKMCNGLRQGDPLAPFLFLVIAEGLNGLLKKAVQLNKFTGFKLGMNSELEVAMVQFADDTLFIGEATLQNVLTLKCVLRCFELASGLKVNFSKSNLIGISLGDQILRNFATTLHCLIDNTPFKYLGLPIGGNPRRAAFWEPVVSRIKKRLASWKNKVLSFGGRICLIKSVLSSIPLFFLSFFKAPAIVIHTCHKIWRRFLWGGTDDNNKIAWLSWDTICKTKEEGGLGIKDLGRFNKALVGKWRWRFLNEKESLWNKVLRAKYICSRPSKASYWWQDLKNLCFQEGNDLWFENLICRRVGDGEDTLFWSDIWLDNMKLSERFPRLYSLSTQKSKSIKEVGSWQNGNWVWYFSWRRNLRVFEEDLLNQMMSSLNLFVPALNRVDSWWWLANPEGQYTVHSAYASLIEHDGGVGEEVFKSLWGVPAISNALAFTWKVFYDRIQTRDNLRMRNAIPSQADLRCPLCLSHEESSPHLLFSCHVAWRIWMGIYNWIGLFTVLHSNGKEHFLQHSFPWWTKAQKQGSWVVWIAVIWTIWNLRNNLIFRNGQVDIDKVLEGIQFKSWSWLKGRLKGFHYTLYEWQAQPLLIMNSL